MAAARIYKVPVSLKELPKNVNLSDLLEINVPFYNHVCINALKTPRVGTKIHASLLNKIFSLVIDAERHEQS
jgi:hypothetical protein